MGDVINFPAHRMARVAPLVSKTDLRKRLNVSERWIEYRMREGMPYRKDPFSRLVRFDMAEVEAWLNATRGTGS